MARATIIVQDDDGRILLVRDRGKRIFSLPGGKIERGEDARRAALRELQEETGINLTRAVRLFKHVGGSRVHEVFKSDVRADSRGKARAEIAQIKWWDPDEGPAPNIQASSREILNRAGVV